MIAEAEGETGPGRGNKGMWLGGKGSGVNEKHAIMKSSPLSHMLTK